MNQKNLNKIHRAVKMWKNGAMAPRTVIVFYTATAIVITSWLMGHLMLGTLSATIVALVLAFKNKAAKTHQENINSLLSNYEPKDKDSFKWLQDETRKVGQLEIPVILEWLRKESKAVNPDTKEISFVSRKV